MFLTRSQFAAHDKKDNDRFMEVKAALTSHDAHVEEKHQENKKILENVQSTQAQMQTSLDDILRLRPAIEAGIASDVIADKIRAELEYRKKMLRRVLAAVMTTAVTMGGLVPLVEWIASLHIHVGVGGG